MAEAYTLTEADVDGMRKILGQVESLDQTVGDHTPGSVQGYPASATATVRFDKKAGAFETARALNLMIQSGPTLALMCKKVIAHVDTHGLPGADMTNVAEITAEVHRLRHEATQDQELRDNFVNDLLENAGDDWDGDESAEHIALCYLRHKEQVATAAKTLVEAIDRLMPATYIPGGVATPLVAIRDLLRRDGDGA